jgi:uncharacterized protein
MSSDARDEQDAGLDETLEGTFPASDAPANTVEVGIRVETPAGADTPVVDNQASARFELEENGAVAFLLYKRTPDSLTIVHTEVPAVMRGRHLGDVLVQAAVASARRDGLRLVVVCPFARAYLKRHPIE